MSLLMDALRKAEEAKRQAAQKQKDDTRQEVPTSTPESAVADDLSSLEDALEFEREVSVNAELPDTSERKADSLKDIDIPFDFEIDEHFKLDESNPVAARSEPSSEPEVGLVESKILEEEPVDDLVEEHSTEDLDYLDSDALNRMALSSRSSSEEPAPPSQFAGLTLEEQPPAVERPSIIGADLEISSESELEPQQSTASITQLQVEAPQESIRATRSDEAPGDEKVASPKFSEESRKRESARAVFNAKHGGKNSKGSRKLVVAAALIAIFPLAGGGYWLLDSLDIFSTGNQYNIPADYDASRYSSGAPFEPENLEQVQLADVGVETLNVELPPDTIASDSFEVPDAAAQPSPMVTQAPEPAPDAVESAFVPSTTDAEVPAISEAVAIEAPLSDEVTEIAFENEVDPGLTGDLVLADDSVPTSNAINITRSENATLVDPQLTKAYASFRSGDFIGARAHYQQVLRDKPNNRDAMLGLAAVAKQSGNTTEAREIYIRLLELDPRDVLARVGLLETMPATDPVMLESELRALFAAHPDVAHLAFALGNHYASQRRWSDAQQSYYDALLAAKASDSHLVSPDYAFNLAVSLERLNQLRPAYTFYREALEQSALVTPGFDIRVLRDRLDALERVLP